MLIPTKFILSNLTFQINPENPQETSFFLSEKLNLAFSYCSVEVGR